jgi:hexokinase
MNEHEEIARLRQELEAVRKTQSGSDRQVTLLQQENEKLKNQLEATTADVEKRLAERAAMLDRRQKVFELCLEKGVDPKMGLSLLLGSDDSDRLDLLSGMVDDAKKGAVEQVLKENGRAPVVKLDMDGGPLSLEAISRLPGDRQMKLSAETTNAAVAAERQKTRRTVGKQISDNLFRGGGR